MTDLKEYMLKRRKEIEDYMDKKLGETYLYHPILREAVRHVPLAEGKRLRPIFLYLLADALRKGTGKDTLPVGVAMEMTHNFTLVHDDIMDNADKRHGVPAVHRKWDINTAINAGDALFARAFELLAEELPPDPGLRIVRELAHMVIRIAEGQQSDLDFETRSDISEEEYMEMVENKTARMFQYAGRFAGILTSQDEDTIDRMGEMGRMFGIGFQIADDILDLTADEEKFKKPVGGDIREGKKTLIVIHALRTMPEDKKEEFLSILGRENASKDEIKEAIELLKDNGSIDYAMKKGEELIENAQAIMNDVVPEGEDKELLRKLIDFMLRRDY